MKYYNFEFIVYDEIQKYLLEKKCKEIVCDYAYILHDKDKNEKGEIKKAHWHFLVFFPFQHTIKAISKNFNIESQYIEVVKNKVGAIRYLIHLDDKNKYQYEYSDIVSNIDLQQYFNRKNDIFEQETLSVKNLIDYIDSMPFYVTITQVLNYALDNQLYSYFRRNFAVLNCYLKEHNDMILESKKNN